jgi:hypothetical protein
MAVGSWERGDRVVAVTRLAALCQQYDVNVSTISAAPTASRPVEPFWRESAPRSAASSS